ncbi:hypothetical protein B5K06_22870, partial [Rhizobium grahamii]
MLKPPFEVATIATCYGGPKAGHRAQSCTRRAETDVEDGEAVAGLPGPGRTNSRAGREVRQT